MTTAKLLIASLLCLPFIAQAHAASVLLDTGSGASFTNRSGSGIGQGVTVSTATELGSFSFYGYSSAGANVKFLIFDGSNTNLLYSQTAVLAASDTAAWISSSPFSFLLNAGSTYYFGVISDATTLIGYSYPAISVSSNGLSSVGFNTNYASFSDPVYAGDGGASFDLQLSGEGETMAVTPEPGSIWLLATGMLGAVWLTRQRLQAH